MQEYFEKFLKNISLTSEQKKDAKKKYKGVCKKIHKTFYDTTYNGSTKYLFGSYKKKTNIRPIVSSQDVDVLIKLPWEIYEHYNGLQNGQSQLIQKIKNILKTEKYTTTDNIKAWGKVILIQFSDGKHNIELLPAFENEDGTFQIPNSSDGGKWETFDPRQEIDDFLQSNNNTNGLTRKLSKIVKKWARTVSLLKLKSYEIEKHIIDFLENYEFENKNLSIILQDFYSYFLEIVDENNKSYIQTALNRIDKAIDYINNKQYEKAVDEWRKIFGDDFPKTITLKKTSLQKYSSKITSPYIAPGEEFIEDLYSIKIDSSLFLELDCYVSTKGFREYLLSYFISRNLRLSKETDLTFFIKKHNIKGDFTIKWKVRNFGAEAESKNCLRGKIFDALLEINETTAYEGDHLVECYVIKNGICVAVGTIEVPIN